MTSSWIIQLDLKYNVKCSCKRKTEGETDRRGEDRGGDMEMQAETGGSATEAKECPKPPEAERSKEQNLP